MDQGLAAIYGAMVGAVATGATALITARSTFGVQKHQARREAYHAFLLALRELYDPAQRCLRVAIDRAEGIPTSVTPEELTDLSREVVLLIQSMRRTHVAVELEGTGAVTEMARTAADAAHDHALTAVSLVASFDIGRHITPAEKANAEAAFRRTVVATNSFAQAARSQL
ncbi:hypothetical protein GCM10010246_26450 [Streptomyces cuspidosporus]|uniref:Proline dehydrogenase n=1 Tax=Streptomyces cuspidosporus TaxID=66882 RepID=A0ABN3FYB4_9ACTN